MKRGTRGSHPVSLASQRGFDNRAAEREAHAPSVGLVVYKGHIDAAGSPGAAHAGIAHRDAPLGSILTVLIVNLGAAVCRPQRYFIA